MNISVGPVVVLGDLHCPYVDKAAFAVTLQVIQAIGPTAVVINGDAVDNYQLSRFAQDPERLTALQADLDSCQSCLREIRDAAPEATLFYTEGNHENRLTRLKCKLPELSSISSLTMPALLSLDKLGITWVREHEPLLFGDWLIMHGNSVCSKGGATAQRMIDRYGCSGISNHVHRLAQVSRSVYGRQMTWVENGCLCNPEQMRYSDLFDWQQGFAVLHRDHKGGDVFPEIVHIKNGKTRYQGANYSA